MKTLQDNWKSRDPSAFIERLSRLKVASIPEIPEIFSYIGSDFYRTAHNIWELKNAEDDQGGYVLVRKVEDPASDMRVTAQAKTYPRPHQQAPSHKYVYELRSDPGSEWRWFGGGQDRYELVNDATGDEKSVNGEEFTTQFHPSGPSNWNKEVNPLYSPGRAQTPVQRPTRDPNWNDYESTPEMPGEAVQHPHEDPKGVELYDRRMGHKIHFIRNGQLQDGMILMVQPESSLVQDTKKNVHDVPNEMIQDDTSCVCPTCGQPVQEPIENEEESEEESPRDEDGRPSDYHIAPLERDPFDVEIMNGGRSNGEDPQFEAADEYLRGGKPKHREEPEHGEHESREDAHDSDSEDSDDESFYDGENDDEEEEDDDSDDEHEFLD